MSVDPRAIRDSIQTAKIPGCHAAGLRHYRGAPNGDTKKAKCSLAATGSASTRSIEVTGLRHVGFRGQAGLVVLNVSSSPLGPFATSQVDTPESAFGSKPDHICSHRVLRLL